MMDSNISHFAINADDLTRARSFYEGVFGWTFQAWGPPDFFQITTGSDSDPGIRGALQRRRELKSESKTVGFECTIAVEDIDAVAAAVVEHGGKILLEKTTIAGVGDLLFFEDPEGNVAGAMCYVPRPE